MSTNYDTVPYDALGHVRLGGELGATRYITVPADWVVGDLVGLLLGAPDDVHVVRADVHEVPVDPGPAASGTPVIPAQAQVTAGYWMARYDAAVGLLAKVYRDGLTIEAHGPHQATTIDGTPVTPAQAQVLYDADEYVDVEAL